MTALDWRGQGASGGSDNDNGDRDRTDWSDDQFGMWAEDLCTFWQGWSAQTAPPYVLVAHSMGGHIALRALAGRRFAPVATVLSAPMLGLQPQFVPRRVLHFLARAIARVRGAWTSARKTSTRSVRSTLDRVDLLTHDADRYADEAWWRKERPELAFAPPTWGWIAQSLASMAELERRGALEAVQLPVLILAARDDRLVSYRAIRRAAARLPRGELVTFGDEARHELFRESDSLRERVLATIDRFLDENARSAGNCP